MGEGKGRGAAAVIGALMGRGLSVSDIAAGAGFHINTVSKWARGEGGAARPQNIARLRRLLDGGAGVSLAGVSLADLITEIGRRGFNVQITSK